MMKLDGEVDVAEAGRRQEGDDDNPACERRCIDRIEILAPRAGSSDPFGHPQLGAPGARIDALFDLAWFDRLRRDKPQREIRIGSRLRPFGSIEPLAAAIAEEIFHDPILERMKGDDSNALPDSRRLVRTRKPSSSAPSSSFTSMRRRLEDLGRGMAPSVAADDFLDRLRQLQRIAKGCFLAQLDDLAGDTARGRLFPELAEEFGSVLLPYSC